MGVADKAVVAHQSGIAFETLTNQNDINRLLHETLAKERSIDSELEGLLRKRGDLERNMLLLQSSTSETLELVRADAEGLAASVRGTSELSERVSKKVRELDMAQSHVNATLSRINIIVERTNCNYGVKDSLDKQDYESAASFVSTYLDLEEKYGPARDEDGAQAQEQSQVLLQAKKQLESVVRTKLSDAIQARNHEDVVRFTKLFKPLRIQGEGLQEFTQYLRSIIAERAKAAFTILVEGGETGVQDDYVGTLTNLFKDIAVAVEENQEFLSSAIGPEAVLDIICGLQQECDAQGSRILQRYINFRQFSRLQTEITRKKGSTASTAAIGLDPREVEGYLEEMLLLCQRSEEYNQFMLSKMADAVAPKPLGTARENAFRGGQFNVTVRELINYYVAMEEYYMEQNISKAIEIQEHVPDTLTSSMVDDVFFILQKCGRRALATSNVVCVCAILGQLNNLLSSTFYPQLHAKLENAATRLLAAQAAATASLPSTSSPAAEAAQFNDAEVSSWYALKLRQELEEFTAQVFIGLTDREQIKSVLSDLAKTSNDLKQLTNWALGQLANATMNRLRQTLDEVASVSYQITEAEYAANEVGGTWVQALMTVLDANLSWLQPLFTQNNYDSLIVLVLEEVARRIDVIISTRQFNQLGGLQLDRDVRNLISYSAELTQRPVRDKFAGLTQKATILSLESAGEMLEYWGENAGPMNWRLSEDDVRKVLRQRTDFAIEDILALPL